MAKIYVIIPVYNVENYLRECVYSVLNQPCKKIEIILIDDGSPDNSGKICDEIAEQEWRVHVIHQTNKGLSGARNAGLEFLYKNGAETNDYVAFVDSDDMWVPNSVCDDIFNRYEDFDVFVFPFYFANNSMNRMRKNPLSREGIVKMPEKLSFWEINAYVWNKFYKVSLLKQNKIVFQEDVKCGEDICFLNIVLYYAKSLCFLSTYLYCYRFNEKSITNTLGKKRIAPWMYEIDGLLNGLDLWCIKDENYRKKTMDYCCWWFLEMTEAYYISLKIDDKPYDILKKHMIYNAFLDNKNGLSQRDKRRINLMMNQKGCFKLKFFVLGLMRQVRNILKKVDVLTSFAEKKKYPLTWQKIYIGNI